MSKGFRWRLMATILVILGSVYVVSTTAPRLGLDLRGGTQIVFEADDTDEVIVDAEVIDRTVEVLRRRVDGLGVTEPTIQASGDRRIIVELPGITDPEQAVDVIGRTAQLTFHPVVDAIGPTGEVPEPEGNDLLIIDEAGLPIVVGPAALIGEHVGGAVPFFEPQAGGWVVRIDFRGEGNALWAALTGEAACHAPGSPARRVAIVLDGEGISSPQVHTDVFCNVGITGGSTIITGNFDQASATELALLIQAGALPVPITIIEQGTIGPTLGQAAIEASIDAALIGAALTILFMIAYYRLLGLVAAVTLASYGLITAALLLLMGATITLPGVAGFVLAIGMAVDANILVYERTKEEFHDGTGMRDAASAGFARAWSAIADANISTLLAAVLLFFFATGPVRGYAVTLSVGVVVSMFAALVIGRVIISSLTRLGLITERPGLMGMEVGTGFRQWIAEKSPDLIGRDKMLMAVALLAVALSFAGMITQGFNLGLEFSGGRLLEFQTEQTPDLDELREELAAAGFPRPVVQMSGQGNVVIRTEQLDPDGEAAVFEAVETVAGVSVLERDQFVGPTLGTELRNRALIALAIALGLQLIYLAFRFRWTMGLASVGSMFHDIAILAGVFTWMGKSIDAVFLAAVLTVIGYSMNDGIVIFDRIREHRRLNLEQDVGESANDAALRTIPRTVNTGLSTAFVLAALLVLGGDTLADFALALLIGVVVGSYSSVFVATPIYVRLERRYPAPIEEKEERPGKSGKPVV